MGDFRKKPVTIQASLITEAIQIETLEGVMTGNAGDWLITGIKGEKYACKPDVFFATYEPADSDAQEEWNDVYGQTPD